ncbi:MAG: threonine-phosphate decarboxylase CobD [Bacillota bacterium]
MEHGGRIWEAARNLGADPHKILDFSANLNPFGPPAAVIALLRERLGDVAHYPEPRGGGLKRALADHLGISPDRLVVGNGAAELIWCFCRVVSPRTVLIPSPTFTEYARAVRACGGEVHHLPMNPEIFRFPLEQLLAALRSGCRYDLVVVCNPNNPTGTLAATEELDALLAAVRGTDTWVLVDESFLGFLPEPGAASVRRLPLARHARLAVLDSFTKLYCLPGLRLGYLTGPPDLVSKIEETRDPWSVSVLAQAAGLQCLREQEYLARTRASLPLFRTALSEELSRIPGLRVLPSTANFLLLRLRVCIQGRAGPARVAASQLAKRLILVRECSDFAGLEDGSYLRVAVRLPQENARLISALREVISS